MGQAVVDGVEVDEAAMKLLAIFSLSSFLLLILAQNFSHVNNNLVTHMKSTRRMFIKDGPKTWFY